MHAEGKPGNRRRAPLTVRFTWPPRDKADGDKQKPWQWNKGCTRGAEPPTAPPWNGG